IQNNMTFGIHLWGETQFVAGRVLMSPQRVSIVAADFTQDGLDDIFVLSDTEAFVATAVDVEDHTKGFKFGPYTTSSNNLGTRYDMAAGDLNNDGIPDVAWFDRRNDINVASVCPGPVA